MEDTARGQQTGVYLRGLCFGAFDPLHYGHIRLFRRASKLCRSLYAVTDGDEIIRAEKGREPFTTQQERILDLSAVKYLSYATVRTETWTRELIVSALSADVLFVGDDWKGKGWIGETLGIPVVYLPYTGGITSTFLRDTKAPILQTATSHTGLRWQAES